jgi:hypothetical protein
MVSSPTSSLPSLLGVLRQLHVEEGLAFLLAVHLAFRQRDHGGDQPGLHALDQGKLDAAFGEAGLQDFALLVVEIVRQALAVGEHGQFRLGEQRHLRLGRIEDLGRFDGDRAGLVEGVLRLLRQVDDALVGQVHGAEQV